MGVAAWLLVACAGDSPGLPGPGAELDSGLEQAGEGGGDAGVPPDAGGSARDAAGGPEPTAGTGAGASLDSGSAGAAGQDAQMPGQVYHQVRVAAEAGGTVTPPQARVARGDRTMFEIVPDVGYHLGHVAGCGGALDGTTYTTGAITADCTITVTFNAEAYTVTSQSGAGGSISPASVSVAPGETASFELQPDSGFALDSVSGCGGALSGDTYTTAAIAQACTVFANFIRVGASAGDVTVTRGAQQTMIGIEGNAAIGEGECDLTGLRNVKDELARRAVEDFGLDRVRLEVRAGAEAPTDWFAQYLDGTIDRPTWKSHFYDEVNDDSDPDVMNPAGFHFSEVDLKIELIVQPLRQALAKHGRTLYVSLNYVDFDATGLHRDNPQEYAEFMLAAYEHIEATHGFRPDAIEILLEPDKAGWGGAQFGANLAALRARMAAAGYAPEYVGPSTMEMKSAAYYFEAAVAAAGPDALDELSYHKYGAPPTAQDYADVRALMTRYGVRSGMLEKLHETHLTFERDLTQANASTWQQLGIAHCGADNGGDYFVLDLSNPSNPGIQIAQNTRYVAQYGRTVYPGAVRYDANGSGGLTPFAFQNADGKWTVVVRADAGQTFTVAGLPSGDYGVFHTTATDYLRAQTDVQTDGQGRLTLQIPDSGVITAHQR